MYIIIILHTRLVLGMSVWKVQRVYISFQVCDQKNMKGNNYLLWWCPKNSLGRR